MLIVEFITIVLVEKKSRIDRINSRHHYSLLRHVITGRYKKTPFPVAHKRINSLARKYSLKCVSIL